MLKFKILITTKFYCYLFCYQKEVAEENVNGFHNFFVIRQKLFWNVTANSTIVFCYQQIENSLQFVSEYQNHQNCENGSKITCRSK